MLYTLHTLYVTRARAPGATIRGALRAAPGPDVTLHERYITLAILARHAFTVTFRSLFKNAHVTKAATPLWPVYIAG